MNDQYSFFDSARPGLQPGTYRLEGSQEFLLDTHPENLLAAASTVQDFILLGSRLSLASHEVHALFPLPNEKGDYCAVLPHLVLETETAPWRFASEYEGHAIPSFCLLMFKEDEKPVAETLLPSAMETEEIAAQLPGIGDNLEAHEKEEQVSIIKVERSLLKELMPAPQDLAHTVHVRTTEREGKTLKRAVVVGSRLPLEPGSFTVHLVSLVGFDWDDLQNGAAGEMGLISLKSWDFACETDQDQPFKSLLSQVNVSTNGLRRVGEGGALEKVWASGYSHLPFRLRTGDEVPALYKGPLVPVQGSGDFQGSVLRSDYLYRYLRDHGLVDISRAAAWELGKWLAWGNRDFVRELFLWRKQKALCACAEMQGSDGGGLPLEEVHESHELPEILKAQLRKWALMEGIALDYLVPHEEMLPEESFRTFEVDRNWIKHLLDGALSVGRNSQAEIQEDAMLVEELSSELLADLFAPEAVSGFILRSKAVEDWPFLQVSGYQNLQADCLVDAAAPQLEVLHQWRPGNDILICWFKGKPQSIDLAPPLEHFHFGFEVEVQANGTRRAFRNPRRLDGSLLNQYEVEVPVNQSGTLQMSQFQVNFQALRTQHPGNFQEIPATDTVSGIAFQSIDGTDRVRFNLHNNTP